MGKSIFYPESFPHPACGLREIPASRYAKIRTIRSLRRVFEQFARGQYTGKGMKKAESA